LIAYLDTHVAVYLAEGMHKRITSDAKRMIDRAELLISPMAVVEMEILNEVRKIKMSSRDIQRKLEHEIGLRVCDLPFPQVADIARDEAWTRDPFDRIIVAQAKANGFASLISSDGHIAQNYPRTVW
jgi:PIN domain nuclease of toxin-antitoxin system